MKRKGHAMRYLGNGSALCAIVLCAIVGCVAPKYVPKSMIPPPIKYCNSTIGHMSGARPWILEGTCCCTPTSKLIEEYHKAGLGIALEDLIKKYKEAGITTDLDHKNCNNCCDHGPHVVKGGKCMATPTMGTSNFEEVISGIFTQKESNGKKKLTAHRP